MIKWNLLPTNIVIRFAPLAGGKFLSSMLTYYKKFQYCLPLTAMQEDLEDYDLESFSHYLKMRSVPEKEFREHWPVFESQDRKFWGFNLGMLLKREQYRHLYCQEISINDTYKLIPKNTLNFLIRKNCIHLTHESSYRELRSLMPNCKIVTVIEADELQTVSMKFKKHHEHSTRRLDIIDEKNCYTFSMKNIFNKKLFFSDLSDFAFKLSGNCEYDSRIHEYYDKYIEIHEND